MVAEGDLAITGAAEVTPNTFHRTMIWATYGKRCFQVEIEWKWVLMGSLMP